MSSTRQVIRRALLYGMPASTRAFSFEETDLNEVPGSSQRMLAKTQGLKVGCVAYDLEDSVTPAKKEEARMNVSRFLHEPRTPSITESAVRINPVGSEWAENDLLDVVSDIWINTLDLN